MSFIVFTFCSASDKSNSSFVFICYINYFFLCLNTRSTVLLKYFPVSLARESLLFLFLLVSDLEELYFWQDFALCNKLSTMLLFSSAIMRAYWSYSFNSWYNIYFLFFFFSECFFYRFLTSLFLFLIILSKYYSFGQLNLPIYLNFYFM